MEANVHRELEEALISNFDGNMKIKDTDQLLPELPDEIILKIICLLPAKDAARTSALSKSWRQVRNALLPVVSFIFDNNYFYKFDKNYQSWEVIEEGEEWILNIVDETLSKAVVQNHKLLVQRFMLDVSSFYYYRRRILAFLINRWISFVTRNMAVERLEIHYLDYYVVENNNFIFCDQSLQSVAVLVLYNCNLRKGLFNDSSTTPFCLRELSLVNIDLYDDLKLNDMLSRCPHLESFSLRKYRKIDSVQLCNHPKLKKVDISDAYYNYIMTRIEIVAPNLEHLKLPRADWIDIKVSNLEHLILCTNWIKFSIRCSVVKELRIDCSKYDSNQSIQQLIYQIPVVESLILVNLQPHHDLRKLEICSKHRLLLHFSDGKLELIKIDATYLCGFSFNGVQLPSLHYTNSSYLREVDLVLRPKNLETLWFINLRKNLSVFDGLKLDLTLTIEPHAKVTNDFVHIEVDGSSPPSPLHVKCLSLVNVPEGLKYKALLEGFLWSSHPTTLSITSDKKCDYKFKKFLYCKLLSPKKIKANCCRDYNIFKCWGHRLKEVDVMIETLEGKHLKTLDVNCSSESLQAIQEGKQVKFALEWYPS